MKHIHQRKLNPLFTIPRIVLKITYFYKCVSMNNQYVLMLSNTRCSILEANIYVYSLQFISFFENIYIAHETNIKPQPQLFFKSQTKYNDNISTYTHIWPLNIHTYTHIWLLNSTEHHFYGTLGYFKVKRYINIYY